MSETKMWVTGRNVPERFAKILRDYLPAQTEATRAVDKWVGTEKKMLVLSGGVGTGKTMAAAALVFETPSSRFLTISEVTRLSRFDEDITILERCPVLAIDDLGEEYADKREHMQTLIATLLNARHAHDVRTIITTNITAPQFQARYGARVWDRFRESGTWVSVGTGSFRAPCGGALQIRRREEVTERPLPPDYDPVKDEPISSERMEEILGRKGLVKGKRLQVVPFDEEARREELQAQLQEAAQGEKAGDETA